MAAAQVWSAVRSDIANFFGHLQHASVVVRDESLLVLTGGPTADFNMALVEASPNDEEAVRTLAARVRDAGLQSLFLFPSGLAERLGRVAAGEGLVRAGSAPLMLLDASAGFPPFAGASEFRLERVEDAVKMGVAAAVIADAFGLEREWVARTFADPSLLGASGVGFWLGTKTGEAYTTVTCLQTGDGPVGIWSMATASQHQRQGAGRAVLEAVLQHYQRAGKTNFYLIATSAGKPLYDALGFRTIDDLGVFIAGHSEQFAQH